MSQNLIAIIFFIQIKMTNTNNSISNTKRPFIRTIIYSIISFVFFSLIIILLSEITVRIFSNGKYAKKENSPPFNTAQKDDYLGWKMTPNYSFDGEVLDQNREPYPVSLKYDENGFKAFGNVNSSKPKVLFIGDSYTASVETSNENTFYYLIKDSLDIEIFAYGQSGFGTLQEYMVLDKWIDKTHPDLIVWSTCSNDFVDNYAPLELVSGYKVGERRPYLDKNKNIYYTIPVSFWQRTKKKIQFFAWLDERIKKTIVFITNKDRHMGEHFIINQNRNYKPYNEAVITTERILSLAKNRIPESTKIIGFASDNYNPQIDEFKNIFEKAGFEYTRNTANAIDKKVFHGETVKSIDGYHWNNAGQAVVAQALIPIIRKALNIEKPKTGFNSNK